MQDVKKRENQYPDLFSPLYIRGKRLKNRITASAMAAPHMVNGAGGKYDYISPDAAMYMGQIARGGAAIVNTGHYGVDPRYQLGALRYAVDFFTPQLHNRQMAVINLMSSNVHRYGALASFELNHGGYMCTPFEGNEVIGPCAGVTPDGKTIIAMDEEEMHRVAGYFAHVAGVAKLGGFDIINVHAAHNWLLGQFLSPSINHRTDEYGGNVENRLRFPLMVIRAIREAVGEDMLISVRYSAAELVEGGATMEETLQAIEILKEYVDIVHCSAGKVDHLEASNFTFPSNFVEHGVNAYLARAVKEHVKGIKVEMIGAVNDPEMADRMIREGYCDTVAMARSFIADNDWARKAHDGHAEDIRPCIRCARCLSESINFCGVSSCTINPRRSLYQILPQAEYEPHEKKRVAVVGGGPAGMQAANELARKGHQVILLEKSGKLGGRLEFANYVIFKEDIRRYREYLIRQVEKQPLIEIRLETEATPELLRQMDPDAVIVAAGAKDYRLPIPGADREDVMHSSELFGHEDHVGKRAVIIGGGAVGCEAAIQLHSMGHDVELVEYEDRLMKGEETYYPDQREFTIYYVTHEFHYDAKTPLGVPELDNVHIHLNSKALEISDAGVTICDKEGRCTTLEADTVILATGLRPDREYLAHFEGCAQDVYFIGDSMKVGNLYNTTTTGLYAAEQI